MRRFLGSQGQSGMEGSMHTGGHVMRAVWLVGEEINGGKVAFPVED